MVESKKIRVVFTPYQGGTNPLGRAELEKEIEGRKFKIGKKSTRDAAISLAREDGLLFVEVNTWSKK